MTEAKLVLCLQFWEGDRLAAQELAKFLAGIQPAYDPEALFVFSRRWDCPAPDPEVLELVAEKFPIQSILGQTEWVGYPDGSNALWMDTVRWCRDAVESGRLPNAVAAFTFEADGSPITRTWADSLRSMVLGDTHNRVWGDWQSYGPHINGNLLISLRDLPFLRRVLNHRVREKHPWDLELYPVFRRGGTSTRSIPHIASHFRSTNVSAATLEALRDSGCVWHHGCKDNSVRAWSEAHVADEFAPATVVAPAVEPFDLRRKEGRIHYHADDPKFPALRSKFDGVVVKWETDQPDSPDKFVQRKNSSALTHAGDNWIAFRRQEVSYDPSGFPIYDRIGSSTVGIGVANEDFSEARERTAALELPGFTNGWHSHYEDPRLFIFNGRPHLSYVLAAYGSKGGAAWNQRLVRLSDDLSEVLEEVPLSKFGNNRPALGRHEKNWMFFEDVGKLLAIYLPHPQHTVFDVRSGQTIRSSPSGGFAKWASRFGKIHGSTPPIRIGDGFLTFFHSFTSGHATVGRRYFVGAYLFRGRKGAYQPYKLTKEPLLSGSVEDGYGWDLRLGVGFQPAVIFPCGAVLSEDGKQVTLMSGLNEYGSIRHKMPLADIVAAM